MTLHAESSAVLAWLLGEPGAPSIRDHLAAAELVIASDLTLVECDRVLVRAAPSTNCRKRTRPAGAPS